ncbi:MAG: hypothetical protein M1268_00270 [Patescibacteria group bacterium]|nr:hypothetical protein [Patescibacteria group bacterium]
MQESNAFQEKWDKKKITVGLIGISLLIGLIGYGLKTNFFSSGFSKMIRPNKEVAGISSSSDSSNNQNNDNSGSKQQSLSVPVNEVRSVAEQQINTIREEVNKIDVVEIASSSPQVQKVLNDLKTLGNYPKDQAKDYCQKICNSL